MSRLKTLDENVRTWLEATGLALDPADDGLYLLKYGSTVVLLTLFERADATFVRFVSVVLKDFEPSMELLQRILRLNTEVLFGQFLLFEDDTLCFSATLHGDHLHPDTFASTLRYVAKVSDDWDDELQRLGGGMRASEILASG